MRKSLLAAWALLPVGAFAYHEGPGQDQLALDQVDRHLAEAHACATDGLWAPAIDAYDAALKLLPEQRDAEALRIRLERAKAQMQASKLPEAHADLRALVDELVDGELMDGKLTAAGSADPALVADARSTFANAQFYMTWLMRLEGLPREKWEPEIEASRQTYRLLAEEATVAGDAQAAQRHREDLESAIRLSRMELKDLQGLPLPSQ